jgi:hypothetical protein
LRSSTVNKALRAPASNKGIFLSALMANGVRARSLLEKRSRWANDAWVCRAMKNGYSRYEAIPDVLLVEAVNSFVEARYNRPSAGIPNEAHPS